MVSILKLSTLDDQSLVFPDLWHHGPKSAAPLHRRSGLSLHAAHRSHWIGRGLALESTWKGYQATSFHHPRHEKATRFDHPKILGIPSSFTTMTHSMTLPATVQTSCSQGAVSNWLGLLPKEHIVLLQLGLTGCRGRREGGLDPSWR